VINFPWPISDDTRLAPPRISWEHVASLPNDCTVCRSQYVAVPAADLNHAAGALCQAVAADRGKHGNHPGVQVVYITGRPCGT
jgi:hypothetical protein